MKWFVAKICFQIITSKDGSAGQFDEQFRLIKARNEKEALEKAQQIGLAEEEHFLSSSYQPVYWKWLGVTELNEVTALEDGIELFSAIKEKGEPDEYLQQVKERSRLLQNRFDGHAWESEDAVPCCLTETFPL